MSKRVSMVMLLALLMALMLPLYVSAGERICFEGQVWEATTAEGVVGARVSVNYDYVQTFWGPGGPTTRRYWQKVGVATIQDAATGAFAIDVPARAGKYKVSVQAPEGYDFLELACDGIVQDVSYPQVTVGCSASGLCCSPLVFAYSKAEDEQPLPPLEWETMYVYGQVYDPALAGDPRYADEKADGIDGRMVQLWRVWLDPQTRAPTQWDMVNAKATNGGGFFIFALLPRTPICEYEYMVKVADGHGGWAESERYPTAERIQIRYNDQGFFE